VTAATIERAELEAPPAAPTPATGAGWGLAVPARLPVRGLSISSIRRFVRCPEDWRRHYIEKAPEQTGPAAIAGRAYGAAVEAHFWAQINGEQFSASDADDLLLSEFGAEVAEARARRSLGFGEDLDKVRENCRAPLRGYLRDIAPSVVEPLAVEREMRARFAGAEWDFVAYLDLDCAHTVIDQKLSGSNKWTPRYAAADLQATSYLLMKQLIGQPCELFEFHVARPGKEEIKVLETSRTKSQLEHLQRRIAMVARQIARCAETGDWGYAEEGSWKCSAKWCEHFASCPGGGALRVSGNENTNHKED
jgi:hypothetical protein